MSFLPLDATATTSCLLRSPLGSARLRCYPMPASSRSLLHCLMRHPHLKGLVPQSPILTRMGFCVDLTARHKWGRWTRHLRDASDSKDTSDPIRSSDTDHGDGSESTTRGVSTLTRVMDLAD